MPGAQWKQWYKKNSSYGKARLINLSQNAQRTSKLSYSLPVLMRAYTAASILERHVHLKLEKSEPVYQKICGLLLTIQHMQEHPLMAHCTELKWRTFRREY